MDTAAVALGNDICLHIAGGARHPFTRASYCDRSVPMPEIDRIAAHERFNGFPVAFRSYFA